MTLNMPNLLNSQGQPRHNLCESSATEGIAHQACRSTHQCDVNKDTYNTPCRCAPPGKNTGANTHATHYRQHLNRTYPALHIQTRIPVEDHASMAKVWSTMQQYSHSFQAGATLDSSVCFAVHQGSDGKLVAGPPPVRICCEPLGEERERRHTALVWAEVHGSSADLTSGSTSGTRFPQKVLGAIQGYMDRLLGTYATQSLSSLSNAQPASSASMQVDGSSQPSPATDGTASAHSPPQESHLDLPLFPAAAPPPPAVLQHIDALPASTNMKEQLQMDACRYNNLDQPPLLALEAHHISRPDAGLLNAINPKRNAVSTSAGERQLVQICHEQLSAKTALVELNAIEMHSTTSSGTPVLINLIATGGPMSRARFPVLISWPQGSAQGVMPTHTPAEQQAVGVELLRRVATRAGTARPLERTTYHKGQRILKFSNMGVSPGTPGANLTAEDADAAWALATYFPAKYVVAPIEDKKGGGGKTKPKQPKQPKQEPAEKTKPEKRAADLGFPLPAATLRTTAYEALSERGFLISPAHHTDAAAFCLSHLILTDGSTSGDDPTIRILPWPTVGQGKAIQAPLPGGDRLAWQEQVKQYNTSLIDLAEAVIDRTTVQAVQEGVAQLEQNFTLRYGVKPDTNHKTYSSFLLARLKTIMEKFPQSDSLSPAGAKTAAMEPPDAFGLDMDADMGDVTAATEALNIGSRPTATNAKKRDNESNGKVRNADGLGPNTTSDSCRPTDTGETSTLAERGTHSRSQSAIPMAPDTHPQVATHLNHTPHDARPTPHPDRNTSGPRRSGRRTSTSRTPWSNPPRCFRGTAESQYIANTGHAFSIICIATLLILVGFLMRDTKFQRGPAQSRPAGKDLADRDCNCRGGQVSWAAVASQGIPDQPYHEQQTASFCTIHAINAAKGHKYLDKLAVLQHAERLDRNLRQNTGNRQWLNGMYYTRGRGNFAPNMINHYLKTYEAGFHLAYHGNLAEYTPENKTLSKINLAHLSRHERYEREVMPGSSKAQVLSRLPANCTAVMLHSYKTRNGLVYGHATCLKLHAGQWWHIDSEDPAPKKLGNDSDWAQIYGKIYHLQPGTPPITAGVLTEAWEGLQRLPSHEIRNGDETAGNPWQVAGSRRPRAAAAAPPPAPDTAPTLQKPDPDTAAASAPAEQPPAAAPTPASTPQPPSTSRAAPPAPPPARADPAANRLPPRPKPATAQHRRTKTTAQIKGTQLKIARFLTKAKGPKPTPDRDTGHTTSANPEQPAGPDPDHTANDATKLIPSTHLRLLHYTLKGGLYRGQEDVKALLFKHNPDIITLAETNITSKQQKSKWLQSTLEGYHIFGPARAGGEKALTIMAIRDHIAKLGDATRVQDANTQEAEGRLVSVQLNLPRDNPLIVSSVYAPAADTAEDLQTRERLYSILGKVMHDTHIIAGDMNATLLEGDRSDTAAHRANSKDEAHQAFAKLHQLTSPDAQGIPRPHTFHSDGSASISSRIDDVLINRAINPGKATLQVMEEGLCSDHKPLLATIDLAPYGCYVPSPQPPPLKPTPRKVLVTPLSQASREALLTKLSSFGEGVAGHMHSLHSTLQALRDGEVALHFKAIESQDGKTPNRLTTLQRRPAADVVNELAEELMVLCMQAQDTAMQVCETKITNPGGQHFRRRKPAAARLSLSNQLKAIRMVSNAARSRGIETKAQVTDLIGELTPNLPAEVKQHWDATCNKEETQDSPPGESEAYTLLRAAARTKRQEISQLDEKHAKEAISQAAARQQRLLFTNPKRAHASIFQKGVRASRHLALMDPATKAMTDDPANMLRIITKHFADAQRHPGGMKTGKYLPGHCARNYPFAQPNAPDRFTLETPATHLEKRPWLHNAMQDPSLFRDCLRSLSHGKAPGPDGIQNEVLQALPHKLHECIHTLFVIMWATGVTPQSWKNSLTTLLWKGKMPETNIKGYRPIALLNTTYKLWTKMLTAALSDYAEQHSILSGSQKGFRQYSNTTQQLQMLVMALEDARMTGQDLYTLLVDFTSAFNMLNHDTLLTIMYDLGFPTDAIDVVQNLYAGASTQVKWGSMLTDLIPIDRGSIQGDSLSPFLFLIYIEPLLRWLQVGGRGYKFGCLPNAESRLMNHLSSAAYADDLAILTNKLSDLRIQADKLTQFADWANLPVNTQKTYASAILHHAILTKLFSDKTTAMAQVRQQLEGAIMVQRAPVAYLDPREPFTYLGVELTMTLDWGPQHRKTLAKVRERLEQLRTSFATPAQKMRIIETAIKPAATYAFCVTPYTKADIRALDSAITCAVKQAHGLPPSAPTAMVHEDTAAFGLGCASLAAAYAHRNSAALVECLRDTGRMGTITKAALEQQVRLLGESTDPFAHAKHCLRARQLASVQASGLELRLGGNPLPNLNTHLLATLKTLHQGEGSEKTLNTLHKALRPLLNVGVTHLGQLLHPNATHVITGRALKQALGRRCKTHHIWALNIIAHILRTAPANQPDWTTLLRTRDTNRDLCEMDRRIHPQNRRLTASCPTDAPDTYPCPTQHVDPDQHLITRYMKHSPATTATPPFEGNRMDVDPAQHHKATHDDVSDPQPKRQKSKDRHRQHAPQAKRVTQERISVAGVQIPKPPQEEFCRHDHNQERTQRLQAAIEKDKKARRFTRAQIATALVNELYASSFQIDKIGGWRMVQCAKPKGKPPRVQIQYLVHWAPSHIEEWALQLHADAGIKYKTATPSPRSAQQDNACVCEICWKPESRAYAVEEDNHDDMPVCKECGKTFHYQCLGQDAEPANQRDDWTCPACLHHPDEPPPSPLLLMDWEPTWEPAEVLEDLGLGSLLKEWQDANHHQPPARPSDLALDVHLDNLTRQGFPPHLRNTWQSTVGNDMRNKIKFVTSTVNPHADIQGTGRCRIEVRTLEVWTGNQKQRSAQKERACIYDPDGRCMATCSLERLAVLKSLFDRAQAAGLHDTLSPKPLHFEQEVLDLFLRYRPGLRANGKDTGPDPKDRWSTNRTLLTAIRTHLGIQKDRFASPLNVISENLQFWSRHPRDAAFAAYTDAYSCQWQGHSFAAPGADTEAIAKAVKWALWSAQNTQQETATLVAVPRSRTAKGRPAYDEWIEQYPKYCTHLTTIRHADGPTCMEDLWWCTGPAEAPAKRWDLDLVLISNLPAQTQLYSDHTRLTCLLADTAGLNGRLTKTAAIATAQKQASRLLQKWAEAWRQQEQPAGIITTVSEKFRQAKAEPGPTHAAAEQIPAGELRQAYTASPLLFNWRTMAYTDGSKMEITEGDTKRNAVGAGLYIPQLEELGQQAEFTIDPAGEGATNTINRAELAALYAATSKGQTLIATDSATSLAQLQRAVHRPMTLRMHKHEELLQATVGLANTIPGTVTLVKIKAHAGHIGNEVADQVAKRAAAPKDGTGIDMVLPIDGRPSCAAGYWLYRCEPADVAQQDPTQNRPPGPIDNLRGDLRSATHTAHHLGFSNTDGIYYTSWQSITDQAHGTLSNGLTTHRGSLTHGQTKVALKYRMGLLYSKRLAFKWGRATDMLCPLCGLEDGGTHMVSGCQHKSMQGMYTERHNKLGRIIMRAIGKGEKGGEVVSMDLGAASKAAADGVGYTARRHVPPEVLPYMQARDRNKLKPDALLVSGETTTARSSCQVHIVELKCCRDTTPGTQLQQAQAQHSHLRQLLIDAGYSPNNIHIVPILVGVSGTIYHIHTLQALQKLGITRAKAKDCARKLHLQAIRCMHNIVQTRHMLAHSADTSNLTTPRPP